ncbi:MAG: zinc ribbon-containing protein [Ruminococcus sp.]|jgi:hypothetical protein|nr:zinc ribbon-containing protein [Ruminococcus sp.]
MKENIITAEELENIVGGGGGTIINLICKQCEHTETFTDFKKFFNRIQSNGPCPNCGQTGSFRIVTG